MIDLTQFTPWTLFTDLGFISILLLVGKFIRVKVKLIQQLFIPPSLIAGLLGLAFGPNGLGWIPLANDLGTYAAILIALVFGALPLSSPNVSMKEVLIPQPSGKPDPAGLPESTKSKEVSLFLLPEDNFRL